MERSLSKRIETVQYDTFTANDFRNDFGDFNLHAGINGLLGLDILHAGGFVIHQEAMEIYPKLV